MPQPELANAFGDNINQELLIWDHLSCFLEKLSCHMAQGFDRAGGFRRETKNSWRAGGQSGRNLRAKHFKKRAETMRGDPGIVKRFPRRR